MGNYGILIMLILMGLMMWFTSRGQRRQQEQRAKMLNQIKPGDKVVTIGGLLGVVDSVDPADETITLDIDGIYLVFERSAIKTVKAGGAEGETAVLETAPETENEEPESAIEE